MSDSGDSSISDDPAQRLTYNDSTFQEWKNRFSTEWNDLPHLQNIFELSSVGTSRVSEIEHTAEWKDILCVHHRELDTARGDGIERKPHQVDCAARLIIIEDICSPLIQYFLSHSSWNISPEMFEQHLTGADYSKSIPKAVSWPNIHQPLHMLTGVSSMTLKVKKPHGSHDGFREITCPYGGSVLFVSTPPAVKLTSTEDRSLWSTITTTPNLNMNRCN